ncbi:MAG TPA: acyclic terpene utilization AtuA family protein, partial [Marmoricola sp.]
QTAQYLNPDVTVDLTSIRLEQVGADRVRISGVRGAAPPERLKVSVNTLGGHRNQVEFVLTGLDIDAKAAWVHEQLEARLEPRRPEIVDWHLDRLPLPDAETEEAASCLLRVTVKDPSPDVVGRAFSSAAVELALASYPGFTMTSPPGSASPYGVYRPAYVDRAEVEQVAVMPDGERIVISDAVGAADPRVVEPVETSAATRRVPLGTFVHARSGDKGGDANVGLWVGQGDRRDERIAWLLDLVTPDLVRSLLPEAKDLDVEVFVLPNLGGVNVLVHGLLGEGVAASTRFDPQAKAVGEWLRSRLVDVPEDML